MKQEIIAVDHFAGGGGTSTGLVLAAKSLSKKVDLTAINHWETAIKTHERNYPWAKHLCQNIEGVDPRKVVPEGGVDILTTSPECTGYSKAAGGRPKNDQSRASGWTLLRWLELLYIDSVLVENVEDYRRWGPLDRKGFPVKSREGETYQAWLNAIRSFGYTVEERILNAADYGAPTSRRRLFVVARKGKATIKWPRPTHSRTDIGRRRWHAAREIIDWSLAGQSIFGRKRPLAPNTIRRIFEGLKRFSSPELRPFIVAMEHGGRVRDIDSPLPTITTAKGGALTLAGPFVLSQGSGGAPRKVDDPLPTIPGKGAHSLVQPFIVHYHGGDRSDDRHSSIEEPLSTIDTANRHALVEPFILSQGSNGVPKSVERDPVPSILTAGKHALVQPFILPVQGFFQEDNKDHNPAKSLDDPLGAITQRGGGNLVEPCLVQYNGASGARSVDEPLGTVTTRDRFGLAEPLFGLGNGRYYLDVRFRMLQPHELAQAMGFPKGYDWGRNSKKDIVKMIGNAVQVDIARALCRALLS